MKIGIGVFGAVLTLALIVLLLHFAKRPAEVAPTVESSAQRNASIRAAFSEEPSVADPEASGVDTAVEQQVNSFFTTLGLAFTRADDRKLASMFDIEAMVTNVEQQGFARLNASDRTAILGILGRGIGPQMAGNSEFLGFREHTLHRIEPITERQVVAYMRYWMPTMENNASMRWWLQRDSEGQWRAYDYEDLNQGIRSSAILGSIIASKNSQQAPYWIDGFEKVLQHLRGDLLPDLEKNRRVLFSIDDLLLRRLPSAVENFFRVARIRILTDSEEFQEALHEIGRLEEIEPDLPLLHHHRGVCYTELGAYPTAIKHYTRYAEQMGWNCDIHELVGESYFRQENLPMALQHAERGLADRATASGCIILFAKSVPMERFAEVATWVAGCGDPQNVYGLILDTLVEKGSNPRSEALRELLERDFPNRTTVEDEGFVPLRNFPAIPNQDPGGSSAGR